jgi:hypothetical protein
MLQNLEKVDLLDVAVRTGDGDPAKVLAVAVDWSDMLPLGEQQRLAFGRLLANRLKLVSVGHRPSLVIFHKMLRWGGEHADHALSDVAKSSF